LGASWPEAPVLVQPSRYISLIADDRLTANRARCTSDRNPLRNRPNGI
jgi:hypothetical protein